MAATTQNLPYGLQGVSEDMQPEQRCSIGESNIQRLLDLRKQALLAMGEELASLKNSGDWRSHPDAGKCRTWEQFICTMQWRSPFDNASQLTPKGAEKLIDGFKDHLLAQHLTQEVG